MDLMLNISLEPLKKKVIPVKKIINESKIKEHETKVTKELQTKVNENESKLTPKLKIPLNDNKQVNITKQKSSNITEKITNNNGAKQKLPSSNKLPGDNFKLKPRSTLDLDEDSNVKDMEKFLSSTSGVNSEPVFSDKSFSKFTDLHPHLVKNLHDRMSIKTATAIQEKSIPPLLNGQDVLMKSATGSGKTLGYAIPLVNCLQAINPPITRESGIFAIIITPTQELSVQTEDVLKKLTNPFVRIVTGVVIGGVKGLTQKRALRKGLNIVIATPNRLLYHLQHSTSLKLDKLKWLVIDEADRMTELGFAEHVKEIMGEIAKTRDLNEVQNVLLSATLTPGVENLAGLTLKNPVRVEVEFITKHEILPESSTEDTSPVDTVATFSMPVGLQHFLLVCPTKLRMVALLSFLLLKCKYGKHTGKVVVFMATQDLVEFHYQLFHVFLKNKSLLQELPNVEDTGIDDGTMHIYQLHGGMEHDKRQAVFRDFSKCTSGFLLTTDVCSRGLDMAQVNWVVQYHPPGQPVDYIHRAGRTARAGSKGKALLFLQPAEVNYVSHLQTSVGGLHIDKVSLRSIMQTALHHAKETRLSSRKPLHTVEESVFLTAKLLEEHVASDTMLQNLARNAFRSLVRSYSCFTKEMRAFFCYRDLHLGHVAKSMACTETPREIAQSCLRNPDHAETVKKQERQFLADAKSSGKRKPDSQHPERNQNPSKKPKLDQAHRNMLAEYGL